MSEQHQGLRTRSLKAALDSSPLWGAARVEDTYNLLAHALTKTLQVLAQAQGQSLEGMAQVMNATLLCGSSLQATLDLDWDEPSARGQALGDILHVLDRLEAQLAQMTSLDPTSAAQAYDSLQELRQRQKTPKGRAKLRERTSVEHTLAHIGHWQGDHARYWSLRKNLFDLRRTAVVYNLHMLARMMHNTTAKAA